MLFQTPEVHLENLSQHAKVASWQLVHHSMCLFLPPCPSSSPTLHLPISHPPSTYHVAWDTMHKKWCSPALSLNSKIILNAFVPFVQLEDWNIWACYSSVFPCVFSVYNNSLRVEDWDGCSSLSFYYRVQGPCWSPCDSNFSVCDAGASTCVYL